MKFIRAAGGQADFAGLDVSDPVAALALAGRLPPLDILVNNAGIGHVGNLADTEAADFDRLHAVNVRSPFNLCKAFVPVMLARGHGSVINIASIGGIVAVRDRLAYTATKHALVGLTKSLALGPLAHRRAVQRHLPRPRRDSVRHGPPRRVSRSCAGLPRDGLDAA